MDDGLTSPQIRAGGGVVWRGRPDGGVDVLLVHRPKYDDWTFPKGKCDPGESDERCALREVEEETAQRCTLGRELPATRYVDNRGRDKLVRYWEMTVLEDLGFVPDDEVDGLLWINLDEAGPRLTYDRDLVVLDGFARWGL